MGRQHHQRSPEEITNPAQCFRKVFFFPGFSKIETLTETLLCLDQHEAEPAPF